MSYAVASFAMVIKQSKYTLNNYIEYGAINSTEMYQDQHLSFGFGFSKDFDPDIGYLEAFTLH